MGIARVVRDEIVYFVPENDINSLTEQISLNVPVTYQKDGSPLSYFADTKWNYSAYRDERKNQSEASHIVDFTRVKSDKYIGELKHAFYTIFSEDFASEGNSMMMRNYARVLIPIVNELDTIGIKSFSEINSISIFKYLESIKGKYSISTIEKKLGALNTISKVKTDEFSFFLPIKSKKPEFNDSIQSLARKYGSKKKTEQAFYIPKRIHCTLMEKALELISDAETELEVKGKIVTKLDLLNSVLEQRWSQIRQSYSEIDRSSYKSNISYQCALVAWRNQRFGTLSQQLANAGIEGVVVSANTAKKDIFGYLGRLFAACLIMALSFSAMRYDELKTLMRDAFITRKFHDTVFHYIVAYESKITGGEEVDYISAPIARKAIEIINKLHQPARNLLTAYSDNPFLMFTHGDRFLPQYRSYTAVRNNLNKFIEYYDIRISAEDIVEIEMVNKNRKGLEVGKLWPLKSHQFRRTLIVNFISHKIADIDAIKQQAKHMYVQMTQYYGNDAEALQAAGIKADQELMQEITDAVVEANINLFKRFHQTDEQLCGVKGNLIMLERENMSALTEEEIAAFVAAGLWNVSLSPFGFCTKGSNCSKTNILDPSSCSLNCDSTILTIENALEWRKLYWKNRKLLNGGLLDCYKGLSQQIELQNRVALKIMKQFNLSVHEDYAA